MRWRVAPRSWSPRPPAGSLLDELLRSGIDERALRAARERGGRGFAEDLEVEPDLRLAVEAALGDVLAGLVLDLETARSLEGSATLIVLREEQGSRGGAGDRAAPRLEERLLEPAVAGSAAPSGATRRGKPLACWRAARGCPTSTPLWRSASSSRPAGDS